MKVQTTKEFDDSTVAKILELVENASSKKARVENFITRFAKYYTPVVTIGAGDSGNSAAAHSRRRME